MRFLMLLAMVSLALPGYVRAQDESQDTATESQSSSADSSPMPFKEQVIVQRVSDTGEALEPVKPAVTIVHARRGTTKTKKETAKKALKTQKKQTAVIESAVVSTAAQIPPPSPPDPKPVSPTPSSWSGLPWTPPSPDFL